MLKLIVAVILAMSLAQPSAWASGACDGDCSSDGAVTVEELVLGVNIALGTTALQQCPSFDAGHDNEVTVEELIVAVNNALNSCPFTGQFFGAAMLNDGRRATATLTVGGTGGVTGTFAIRDAAAAGFFGGASAVIASGPITGDVNLDTGVFTVTGSIPDGNGGTIDVSISGTLPGLGGGGGSLMISINGQPFSGTVAAGDGSTPTPTHSRLPATATPTTPVSNSSPTPTPSPTRTPTTGTVGGQRLVCAAPDAGLVNDIVLLNTDGSGKVNLTNTTDAFDRDPEWSPNGMRIVWSASVRDQNGGLRYHISAMNADGSGRADLTPDESDVGQPSWSPDGNRIVFVDGVGRGRIKVINADGSGSTTILPDAGERFNSPHWVGNRIVFASTLHIAHDSKAEDLEIYLMNPDGTNITRVTNNSFRDEFPVLRADGQRIAFQSTRPTGQLIWFINPNGSGETPQPGTIILPNSMAAYSHDGQQLAYYGALPFQGFFGGIIIAKADASSPAGVPGTNGLTDFDLN
ncbi:MAG: PD40 domain-containing protein [Deltaproteobacteria bacterium]|nr:PD40 domain-containing protein [Deltaproteobacteria bacterium]MBI3386551.1 PD40 domain-containing protein [Deltaproteobacteria bacterium]